MFEEGKYVEAITCFTQSIAMQPTPVALSNRALASLKIRRYKATILLPNFDDSCMDCQGWLQSDHSMRSSWYFSCV